LFSRAQLQAIVNLIHHFIALGGRWEDIGFLGGDLLTFVIRYSRILFFCQQIDHVYMNHIYLRAAHGKIKETLNKTSSGWAFYLVDDMLLNGLNALGMKPFRDLVLKGSALSLIEKFMDITNYMSALGRVGVVRALYGVAHALHRMMSARKDVGETYMTNCVSANDIFIELLNSLIARQTDTETDITLSDIQMAVNKVAIRWDLQKAKLPKTPRAPAVPARNNVPARELGPNDQYLYRGEGEVIKEVMQAQTKTALSNHPILAERIMTHLSVLAALDAPPDVEPVHTVFVKKRVNRKTVVEEIEVSTEPFAAGNSIAGLIRFGATRGANIHAPELIKLLDKKLSEKAKRAGRSRFENLLYDKTTCSIMQKFLVSKTDTAVKKNAKKADLVAYIHGKYTASNFCAFLKVCEDPFPDKGSSDVESDSDDDSDSD